jgi:tRNA (cmo5U34)-methyltransferase
MKVGNKIKSKNASWSFRGQVFKNFDNHISKSIPLYFETINLYENLSDFFIMDKSNVIDIGCSTGTFLQKINKRHLNNLEKKIFLKGYDVVPEMLNYAKKKNKNSKINFSTKDALKVNYKNSCIVSAFYTMQFIATSKRQELVNKIFKGLNWGGAFFMVEKVRANDARFQDIMTQLYTEFKLSNGYSDKEIISKGRSLKGVLEPFSTKGNLDMLKRAGFKDIITVIKHGCFEGFLAIK